MAVAMDNVILENILRQVRPLIGQGKVADYIPALATVDGSRTGIAICTVDGQLFQAGDAQERFSIQSISKVLSLVVAMRHYSEEEIWQRVGKIRLDRRSIPQCNWKWSRAFHAIRLLMPVRWSSAICCKGG